jgi:glycine cleavage system H protein
MANIPDDLKYTKTHEWVRLDGSTATIGVTDFAQSELSDIVYVEITTVGKQVKHDQALGTIEAVKAVSDLYAPVEGEVIEANEELKQNPAAVNKDPYGAGWMARVRVSGPEALSHLLDPKAYADVVARSAHH